MPSPVFMALSPDKPPRSPQLRPSAGTPPHHSRGIVPEVWNSLPPPRGPSPVVAAAPTSLHHLYTQSLAVYVGINTYADPTMRRLRCAVADAKAVEKVLRERHGFRTVAMLLDADATKSNIEQAFDDLRRLLDGTDLEQARMLFYFAGHGIKHGSTSYLCPYEAQRDRAFSTCINLSFVPHYARDFSAMHQLYILDACHSGGLLTLARNNTLWGLHLASHPTVQGMTAVSESEEALESGGRGVFSQALVHGLQGDAFERGATFLTALALFEYVQESVFYRARCHGGVQTPQFGKILPRLKGRACDGEFLFFDVGVRK